MNYKLRSAVNIKTYMVNQSWSTLNYHFIDIAFQGNYLLWIEITKSPLKCFTC